jgi:multidrug resistance efflux pump
MLELIVCALFTLVPDFLYRRFVQGKRLGREITIFSVWFELRWGLVTCLMLTISLITLVFYFHPATTYVSAVYRSVPIIPETIGRVAEVHVRGSDRVEAGEPIFRLDDASQRTAVETARRQVAEVDAAFALARADLAQSEARVLEAQWNLQQAIDEFETKRELARTEVAARREVERLEVLVRVRQPASRRRRPARPRSRPASPNSSPPRRPAPRRPLTRPRPRSPRPWSAPASPAGSSSSRCRSATW